MANDNKKKVYSIVINGLKESVDLTKSLNDQLRDIEGTLKKIGSQKIKIQGQVEIDTSKAKKIVSGNEAEAGSNKEALVAKEKELALQKQIAAEVKATGQAQAATTDEYKKALQETIKQQNATKEVKQQMTDMFNGARDSAGQYTNTLAGLRAELRDLTKEQRSVELGTEEYQKLDDRILALQSNLKALEQAHGDFRRNVGNYPTAEVEAFRAKFEELYGNMQRLVEESNNLQRELSEKAPGTAEYQALQDKLKGVQTELSKAKDAVNDFNASLKATPSNFEVKVGDTVRNFNSVKDAVKTLTQELQQMTIEGKTETKEFQDTISTLGRLKTAIKSASDETASYVGNAKGLSDTLEIMKGVSGIASIGQGLMMLFGGTNKELDETIQKFAGLMLVMQGVESEWKAMQDTNSIFGKHLMGVWNWLDKIGNWKFLGLPSMNQVIEKTKQWSDTLITVNKWNGGNIEDKLHSIEAEMLKLTDGFKGMSASFKQDFISIADTLDNFRIVFDTRPAEEKLDILDMKIITCEERLNKLNQHKVDIETGAATGDLDALNQEIAYTEQNLKNLQDIRVGVETGDTEDLFKNINEQVDSFESKLDELEGKGIDTKKFRELWGQLKTVSQNADIANKQLAMTPGILKSIGVAGAYLTKMLYGIVTAFKSLLKATVILAAVQIAFEALTWAVEKLADAFKALKGPSSLELEDRLDMIGDAAERAKKKIDDYADACDRAAKQGLITELDAEILKFKSLENAAMDAAKGLKEYLNRQDEIKAGRIENNLNPSSIWGNLKIEDLKEFEKEYQILIKAVENGTDKVEAGSNKARGWLVTAGDAVQELGDKTKVILGQMQDDINHINFNNPEEAIKQFKKITDNELYQSAIANMHKLFPEEEWAKSLDRMYKIFSDRVADMEGRAQDLGTAIIAANRQLANQTELSNINAIADPKKRQAALDEYNKKQRQKEINNSLADEEHKQKALAALDKEYKQKAIDRQKSYQKSVSKTTKSGADDEEKILKQIRDNHLAIMKEGLDKEIKQLENSMQDELKAAEKATKHRGELILSIQEKYNYLIQKKREEWFKKHRKAIEDFNAEILAAQKQAAAELAEVMGMAKLNDINRGIDENENQRTQSKRNIQYDYTIDVDENIENNNKMLQEQKKFHNQMLAEEKKYLEEKHKLQLEESKQNMDNLLREEEARYQQQIAANEKAQKEKTEEVYEMWQQGIVTQEEALQMQLEISEKYETAAADMFEAHQTRMAEIEKNAQQEQKNILEQGLQEKQQAQDEANNKTIQSIQEMYDEIEYISQEEQRKNTNRTTGLFNLGKERKRLEEVKKAYEDTMKEIEDEYEELKRQLNDGEIDFDQFTEAKKQLDALKKQAKDSARQTAENLDDLFQTWAQSINDFGQKIASEFQSLYGTFNEIMNLKYDMEEEALDKEQEQLDKESDMVEKAYDKQAEIVQRYKDAINDTENELSTARGERRLALIDGLAKQREAYLSETEALQKQQMEKEKIAKKEEILKKKQDALEKKRKQQQKQQNLVSAIINTALGVTQALGAYPPPASYALAAVVGALGAVQIGLIASQKFAKGGIIDAPSHQQGGYKIPTKNGVSEVEGNEFITNKKTTMQNTEMLYYINSIKRKVTREDMEKFFDGKGKVSIPASYGMKFAQGGSMPELTDWNLKQQIQPMQQEAEKTYIVQVVDIANAMDNYENVKTLAGLAD